MYIFKLFRVKDWLITKLLFNLSFLLFVFYTTKPSINFIIETIGLLLIYILSIGSFGYFINDCFDADSDRLQGKCNETYRLSLILKIILSCLLLCIGVIPVILIISKPLGYFCLLLSQTLLLLLYSAPLIKLKRNILGIFADSLFSFLLPAFITIFFAVRHFDNCLLYNNLSIFISFILWLFFNGLRSILIHQQHDFDNDLFSKTHTFTTNIGKIKASILIRFLICSEIIAFIVLTFFLPLWLSLATIISLILYLIIEILINFNNFRLSTGIVGVASKLNVFYNHYIFVGISILMSFQISKYYLFIVLVFILIKRSDFNSIIMFFYYKSVGAKRRLIKLFYKKN